MGVTVYRNRHMKAQIASDAKGSEQYPPQGRIKFGCLKPAHLNTDNC